jgi:hypothetical protein
MTTRSTDEPGKLLASSLATKLNQIGTRASVHLGLVIEAKDVDAVGPGLVKSLEEIGVAIEVGCVWTHKRKSSSDITLVDISRTHLGNIRDCNVVAIVHLGQMCVSTLKAIKSRIWDRLNDNVVLIILSTDPVINQKESLPTAHIAFCDLGFVVLPDQGEVNALELGAADWSSDPFGPDYFPQFIQDRIRSEITRLKDQVDR